MNFNRYLESLTKKTVFVTGATGLLGNNLVRQLIDKGYHVKALVRLRQKANKQFAPHDELEIIEGDMTNAASFESHLKGWETVFHTAAFSAIIIKAAAIGPIWKRSTLMVQNVYWKQP